MVRKRENYAVSRDDFLATSRGLIGRLHLTFIPTLPNLSTQTRSTNRNVVISAFIPQLINSAPPSIKISKPCS